MKLDERLKAIADLFARHGLWDYEEQPDENDNSVDRATFVSLCGEYAERLRKLLDLN